MATLAIQELVRDGALEELTLEAAAASDVIDNSGSGGGRRMLIVVGMNAGAITLTCTPGGAGALTIGDSSLATVTPVTLDLGTDQPSIGAIGPLRANRFGAAPVVAPSSPTDISYALVEYPAA